MKLTKENILGDFMIAIEHLTNYKPKAQLLAQGSIKRTFLWFPLVGLLMGSTVTLLCTLLYSILDPSLFMAFACGVLYAGLAYYLEVSKGINALLKLTNIYSGKKYESEFKTFVSEYLRLIVTCSVIACKILVPTALLYYNKDAGYWLILPFVLTSASVGAFASVIKRTQLQFNKQQVNYAWIVAVIVSTLISGIYGFAVAGSVVFGVKQLFTKIFMQDESIQYLLLTASNEVLFCIVLLAGSIIFI